MVEAPDSKPFGLAEVGVVGQRVPLRGLIPARRAESGHAQVIREIVRDPGLELAQRLPLRGLPRELGAELRLTPGTHHVVIFAFGVVIFAFGPPGRYASPTAAQMPRDRLTDRRKNSLNRRHCSMRQGGDGRFA